MSGGLIIPDKKTAKALNDLARHTAILRILKDVRIDLEIWIWKSAKSRDGTRRNT